MRSIFAASFLVASVSAFALSGCAAQAVDQADDEGEAEVAGEALSKYGQQLVGAFATGAKASSFDHVVFHADGTFFADEIVQCFAPPCDPIRTEGKFKATQKKGQWWGTLTLKSKGATRWFYTYVTEANETFWLSENGSHWFRYQSEGTYCAAAEDCEKQSYVTVKCVGYKTCGDDDKCGYKCGAKPVCDESLSYASRDPEACKAIKFGCDAGFEHFFSECGCGCKPVETKPCVVTGCSSQLCAEEHRVTTCEWREEYACYQTHGVCERDASGACGWRKTDELGACLASH